MDKTNLTQKRQAAEDDSDVLMNLEDAYCYECTERVAYCRCFPGEGANRIDAITIDSDLTDSDLLEDIEYTRLRRTSTEFAQVGGVRDF